MIVGDAKDLARRWVLEEGSALPGFRGAFFHGSTTWLADGEVLPAGSDVDVMVALAEPLPPRGPGKFRYREVVLEVSYLPGEQIRFPDQVLGRYDLAGSLRTPSVIADPTGQLGAVQAAVARDFARRRWVWRRCEDARDRVLRNARTVGPTAPFHDQVTAWLFASGVLTHVLLVAGLRNPTVRRRYVAVRELLAGYGRSDFYELLLGSLGCAEMGRSRVEHHLAALADAFDAATSAIRTPFPFAPDISDLGRPIAIGGSRELIAAGSHREAVFWIVATYSRCQKVLHHDGPPATRARFDAGYRDLLGDLGIASPADLRRRAEQVEGFLPQVWAVAEAIMAANPAIGD